MWKRSIRSEASTTASLLSPQRDRKSTRLNSSHSQISYAVFCLKKKKAPPFAWELKRYLTEKQLHIVKLEPLDANKTVARLRSELLDFIKQSSDSRVAITLLSLL